MRGLHHKIRRCSANYALLLLVAFALSPSALFAQSPFPAPSSAQSLFKDQPFGPLPPPTPPPKAKPINLEDEVPIPLGWYLGGTAIVLLALGGLFYRAGRRSHSSNLFDRQYRFPTSGAAALRLGASKCGGHMATLNLGGPVRSSLSETKDL